MATVVGIFPDLLSVSQLVRNLDSAGYDISRAHVISTDDIPTHIAEAGARCTCLGDIDREITGRNSMISGSGTINVPGVTDARAGDGMLSSDELEEHLADLDVPDGRTDDYAIAVESGRAIAGMRADAEQAEPLRGVFSSAGATVVDVFDGTL